MSTESTECTMMKSALKTQHGGAPQAARVSAFESECLFELWISLDPNEMWCLSDSLCVRMETKYGAFGSFWILWHRQLGGKSKEAPLSPALPARVRIP